MAIIPDALLAAYHQLYEVVWNRTAYLAGGPDGYNLISYEDTAAIDANAATVWKLLNSEVREPL